MLPQPCEQVRHEVRYAVGRRADVVNLSRSGHGHSASPVMTRHIHQSGHQDLVRAQQIGLAGRFPLHVLLIGSNGVASLLNLPQRRDDRLAVENGGDLLLGEPVALDRQRAADGADAVDAPQTSIPRDVGRLRPADRFTDLLDAGQHVRRDRIRRVFSHVTPTRTVSFSGIHVPGSIQPPADIVDVRQAGPQTALIRRTVRRAHETTFRAA